MGSGGRRGGGRGERLPARNPPRRRGSGPRIRSDGGHRGGDRSRGAPGRRFSRCKRTPERERSGRARWKRTLPSSGRRPRPWQPIPYPTDRMSLPCEPMLRCARGGASTVPTDAAPDRAGSVTVRTDPEGSHVGSPHERTRTRAAHVELRHGRSRDPDRVAPAPARPQQKQRLLGGVESRSKRTLSAGRSTASADGTRGAPTATDCHHVRRAHGDPDIGLLHGGTTPLAAVPMTPPRPRGFPPTRTSASFAPGRDPCTAGSRAIALEA